MSLWPVEDDAARAWMRSLYQARFRDHLGTADAGIAGGEHGPFDAVEIERSDLLRGEDAVLFSGRDRAAGIGSGQGEAGEAKGVRAEDGGRDGGGSSFSFQLTDSQSST